MRKSSREAQGQAVERCPPIPSDRGERIELWERSRAVEHLRNVQRGRTVRMHGPRSDVTCFYCGGRSYGTLYGRVPGFVVLDSEAVIHTIGTDSAGWAERQNIFYRVGRLPRRIRHRF